MYVYFSLCILAVPGVFIVAEVGRSGRRPVRRGRRRLRHSITFQEPRQSIYASRVRNVVEQLNNTCIRFDQIKIDSSRFTASVRIGTRQSDRQGDGDGRFHCGNCNRFSREFLHEISDS